MGGVPLITCITIPYISWTTLTTQKNGIQSEVAWSASFRMVSESVVAKKSCVLFELKYSCCWGEGGWQLWHVCLRCLLLLYCWYNRPHMTQEAMAHQRRQQQPLTLLLESPLWFLPSELQSSFSIISSDLYVYCTIKAVNFHWPKHSSHVGWAWEASVGRFCSSFYGVDYKESCGHFVCLSTVDFSMTSWKVAVHLPRNLFVSG